jgi:hypothetical protein
MAKKNGWRFTRSCYVEAEQYFSITPRPQRWQAEERVACLVRLRQNSDRG